MILGAVPLVSNPFGLFARSGAGALLAFVAFGCIGSTTPPPQQPQQQPVQQPPPQPPPEPPPLPRLMVRPIRSVDTPRVPRTSVQDLSRKLNEQIAFSGKYSLAETSTTGGSTAECLVESCELDAAKASATRSLLHTRLIQYAEQCVLLSVLYETESGRNEWAFARAFPCDAAGADAAVSELGSAFLSHSEGSTPGPVWGVAPVQHDIKDVDWASESFGEVLTTLLAAGGKAVVPSSNVAALYQGKKDPSRGCPDKACALKLATAASAQLAVSTKVTKKKQVCTISSSVYETGAKNPTATAKAEGGCAAADLAGGLKTIAGALIEATPPKVPEPVQIEQTPTPSEGTPSSSTDSTPPVGGSDTTGGGSGGSGGTGTSTSAAPADDLR